MAGNGDDGVKPRGKKTSKRKDTKDLIVLPVEKKPRVERVKPIVSVGTKPSLNNRNKLLLENLALLITNDKLASEVTENRLDVLECHKAAHGVYIERMADSFFVWMSNCSKKIKMKFELLAEFDADSEGLNVKKPLLAFSHGFDAEDSWKGVKELLTEMFAYDGISIDSTAEADYLYAFTKISGKVGLYVYKIHSIPSLEADTMRLQQVGPSFILRPVQIIRPDGQSYVQGRVERETANSLDLTSHGTYLDKARPESIPYCVECLNIDILLPAPADRSEWEGFNTTATEFFERYHAFKIKSVPGTGPHTAVTSTPAKSFCHLRLPFKVFARSLLVEVTDHIEKKDYSFRELRRRHIRFKGKTLAILGAERIPYAEKYAEENLKSVGRIIRNQLVKVGLAVDDFPPDLNAVLELLKSDAMDNYTLAKNSVVWMHWRKRCHVMDDLYADFMYYLSAKQQFSAREVFPEFQVWVNDVKQNWLLDDCRMYSLPKNKTEAEMVKWHTAAANKLLPLIIKQERVESLYNCQQCFKNIRNPFHHLHNSAEKLLQQKLSREEIDLVVSSCFAEVYAKAQQQIPRLFLKRAIPAGYEYASYKGFESYFPPIETVEFEADDLK